MTDNQPSWQIFGRPIHNRKCGSCQACCTHVPVQLPTEHKAAGVRCPQLRSSGCSVYATRPECCRAWSCKWLFDEATIGLRRPDHSGYIIDPMLDTILADGTPLEVVQIWADPARPLAHRDPALRSYLSRLFETHGLAAIVRHAEAGNGVMLIPPGRSATGEWLEISAPLIEKSEMQAKLARRRG